MQFRLVYDGKLKGANSKDNAHIQFVRRVFHDQLKQLWTQAPASDLKGTWDPTDSLYTPERNIRKAVGPFKFVPLVTERFWTVAHLGILFLRPAPPGSLFRDGGDIDNRIKTLIDALRVPVLGEIPKDDQPLNGEDPFFCLLDDDKLVTGFSVESDRLLDASADVQKVRLVITVQITGFKTTLGNLPLIF